EVPRPGMRGGKRGSAVGGDESGRVFVRQRLTVECVLVDVVVQPLPSEEGLEAVGEHDLIRLGCPPRVVGGPVDGGAVRIEPEVSVAVDVYRLTLERGIVGIQTGFRMRGPQEVRATRVGGVEPELAVCLLLA